MDAMKTPAQTYRERRDRQIYKDWTTMTSEPGASRTQVRRTLQKKYGLFSSARFYEIINQQAQLAQSQQ